VALTQTAKNLPLFFFMACFVALNGISAGLDFARHDASSFLTPGNPDQHNARLKAV